ncbi:MAG: PQQ-dependent sugar dehydrogenase [Balneolaceae bacterium]
MELRSLYVYICTALLLTLFLGACSPDATEQQAADEPFTSQVFSTQYERILVERVAGPFERPWGVGFLPDGRHLVTEKAGTLYIVDNGTITPVSGTPDVSPRGQGGLLDVLVHHDYDNNGWVYLTYSKPGSSDETATALVRGRIDENNAFVDSELIFEQDRYSSPGRHYGSRLAWTNDGKLLMSIGDRGADPPRAQDPQDHAGTLLRMNDDGSVPDDNPFVGDDSVLDHIYSYGHRNIQGLIVNPENGEIWSTEHGPRGGDELNIHQPGENYGWPTVTLGRDYRSEGPFPGSEARSMEGMVDPVYEFLPTHAPSGLALVTGDRFPAWEGNLLAGGLRSERIRRLVLNEGEVIHDEEILLGEIGRIRDVKQGPDGAIYVLNDASDGGLYRITPDQD